MNCDLVWWFGAGERAPIAGEREREGGAQFAGETLESSRGRPV